MFENFSDRSRRAIFYARQSAGTNATKEMCVDDVVIGVVKELGLRSPRTTDVTPSTVDLPLSGLSSKVLRLVVSDVKDRKVEPIDILKALVRVMEE